MATRFAGDVFNQPFSTRDEEKYSVLLDYFPEFKDFSKRLGSEQQEKAVTKGGFASVTPFTGFKPMKKEETEGVPKFTGFKERAE